jgi:hypothetical protein
MNGSLPRGSMLGEAACFFRAAHQNLAAGLLRWDAAGLEPTEQVADLVEAVGELSAGAVQLADEYGHAEVHRRAALATNAAPSTRSAGG